MAEGIVRSIAHHDIVVIGASAGGLEALPLLPSGFPAALPLHHRPLPLRCGLHGSLAELLREHAMAPEGGPGQDGD